MYEPISASGSKDQLVSKGHLNRQASGIMAGNKFQPIPLFDNLTNLS